jgi:heptosyltransferase-2
VPAPRHPEDAVAIAPAPVAEPAPEPEPLPADGDRRASLVIQTSFLGDMVLTTPLIAELASRGPVDVVATPASAPLLANNPSVRDVVVYDKRRDDRGMYGLWRAARALRGRARGSSGAAEPRRIAAAYLAQGSMRSAMLAVLAGIRVRVGFSTSAGRALYTRSIDYREDKHHAERLWSLGAEEGASPTPAQLRPRLFPGDRELIAVEQMLAEAGHRGEPLIALAPGSVWATKRWPYYGELARRLATRGRIVIVGGKADAALAATIAEGITPFRPIDATGRLSLLASAELIGRTTVLVTNDSAPQHLASAMGTPTVAIFGPTVPEFGFGPLSERSAVAGHPALDCRPCDRHGPRRCPLVHWRCMRELSVERLERLTAEVSSNPLS